MAPYYFMCLFPLLLAVVGNKDFYFWGTKGRIRRIGNAPLLAFFLILFVLLSLRDKTCGKDLNNYFYYFQTYGHRSFSQLLDYNRAADTEIGYRFLTKGLFLLSGNFQVFLTLIALLSLLPLWFLYDRESEMPVFSIALFLAFAPVSLYFSGIRQALAMGVAVPAYYFAKSRKVVPFLCCILLAASLHTSAVILLLLYPLWNTAIKGKWLFVAVPVTAGVFFGNRFLFHLLYIVLGSSKYADYAIQNTGSYGMYILVVALLIMTIILTENNDTLLDQEDIGYRNILFMIVCIQSFVPLSTIVMRLNYYFMIFLPVIIPRMLKKASLKYTEFVPIITSVLFAFCYIYYILNANLDADILQVYPYVPFWER